MSKKQVKVITTGEYGGIPEGSVFHGVLKNGEYTGIWSSMAGSYTISVPEELVQVWNEEKHDPIGTYWRKKYAEDAAQDKEGELPKLFLEHSIRDIKEDMKADERRCELSYARSARWLQALEVYYAKHYGDAK